MGQVSKRTQTSFEPLCASRTARLTTFRHHGQGVATLVEVHVFGSKAYFYTWSTTGKVKRLALNPRVLLAPCALRGELVGPVIEGVARCLEGRNIERANARLGRRRPSSSSTTARKWTVAPQTTAGRTAIASSCVLFQGFASFEAEPELSGNKAKGIYDERRTNNSIRSSPLESVGCRG